MNLTHAFVPFQIGVLFRDVQHSFGANLFIHGWIISNRMAYTEQRWCRFSYLRYTQAVALVVCIFESLAVQIFDANTLWSEILHLAQFVLFALVWIVHMEFGEFYRVNFENLYLIINKI